MNPKFIHAIKIISKLLDRRNIKWALIGSTNMQLQGIDINPRDLDVVVRLNDLYKIHEVFSEYKPSEVKKLPPMTDEPGWEVNINIEGVNVQILGERDTGEYVSKLIGNHTTKISIDNFQIPCFTLEVEAQAYSETNREQKAELIRKFLKKN